MKAPVVVCLEVWEGFRRVKVYDKGLGFFF